VGKRDTTITIEDNLLHNENRGSIPARAAAAIASKKAANKAKIEESRPKKRQPGFQQVQDRE